jgi:hypothetical protein
MDIYIWCLALDFIKAFDSVSRKLLWKYLEKLGVAKQLIHVYKKLYERFAMDVESLFSFLSTIGVRQGDVLGPEFFRWVSYAPHPPTTRACARPPR